MNKQDFIKKVSELNINITEEQLSQLDIYCKFLLEYNTHTNLTAIKEEEQVYLKHFYDSLTITKIIDINNKNICDLGSGAGFPGLVLAICFPNANLTLIESNGKKCNFLKIVKDKLKLNNVTIINARVEEYAKENREIFVLMFY